MVAPRTHMPSPAQTRGCVQAPCVGPCLMRILYDRNSESSKSSAKAGHFRYLQGVPGEERAKTKSLQSHQLSPCAGPPRAKEEEPNYKFPLQLLLNGPSSHCSLMSKFCLLGGMKSVHVWWLPRKYTMAHIASTLTEHTLQSSSIGEA